MIETVEFTYKVYDNCIEITPTTAIADNYFYDIKIDGIKAKNKSKTMDTYEQEVMTALSPMYCSVEDVMALIDVFELPEEKILYFIRNASKYVDYILKTSTTGQPKFEITQLAKYKAAIDALTRAYLDMAANSGQQGALGDISFKNMNSFPGIKDILKNLKEELKMWEYAARGFGTEGRVKPWVTVKGIKGVSSNSTAPSWDANFSSDFGRGPNA